MSNKKAPQTKKGGQAQTEEVFLDEVVEDRHTASKSFPLMFNLMLMPLAAVLCCFTVYYTLVHVTDKNGFVHVLMTVLNLRMSPTWDQAARHNLVMTVSACLALIVLACLLLCMCLRLTFINPAPYKYADHPAIALVNRIISNTLEHSTVFLALYTYYVFRSSSTQETCVGLGLAYVIARVFFAGGYVLQGLLSIMVGRVTGVMMTLLVNLMLAFAFFGRDYTGDFVVLFRGVAGEYLEKVGMN